MATTVQEGQLRLVQIHKQSKEKDPNIEGLLLSSSDEFIQTVYNEEFPEGKTWSKKHGFTTTKEELHDKDGNIDRLIYMRLPFNTSPMRIDADLWTWKFVFDKDGKIVKEECFNTDNVVRDSRQYFYNGNTRTKVVAKDKFVIKTIEFDQYGNIVEEYGKTINGKTPSRSFSAVYEPGDEHRVIETKNYEKGLVITATRRRDETNHIIEEVFVTRKMYDDKRVIETVKTIFDPLHDYKVSRVERNGELTEDYRYDEEGEVIYVFLKDREETKVTRLSSETDPETGEKTITRVDHITYDNGTTVTEISKRIYDANDCLITDIKNDGSVTTYTYDENNRRLTATHKVVYNEQLIVAYEVKYTYDDSQESSNTVVREFTQYDVNGNIVATETTTMSKSELKDEHISERREYVIPSNSEQE